MLNHVKLSAALLVVAVAIGAESPVFAGVPVDRYDFGTTTNDVLNPQPFGTIALGAAGKFYGSAPNGGANGMGGVFEITPSFTESVLGNFTSANSPTCQPGVNRAGGSMIGSCYGPYASGGGTIYRQQLSGANNVLHTFTGAPNDGASPDGPPVSIGSYYYGTTAYGGANNFGTIYQYDPTNHTETVLYSFTGGADGKYPAASFLQENYSAGGCTATSLCLVGSAEGGGANNCGTIFQFVLPATLNVLHTMACTDGSNPVAEIIQPRANGTMYGTTDTGGANGDGVLFSLVPNANVSLYGYNVLHDFAAASDGSNPQAALVFYRNKLYGTCINGGNAGGWLNLGQGSIFEYNLRRPTFTTAYLFNGSVGTNPAGGLVKSGSLLYGDTILGGAHNAGIFYSFAP